MEMELLQPLLFCVFAAAEQNLGSPDALVLELRGEVVWIMKHKLVEGATIPHHSNITVISW